MSIYLFIYSSIYLFIYWCMSVRLMVYGIWCSATAVVSSNKILVSTDINIVMFVCVCVSFSSSLLWCITFVILSKCYKDQHSFLGPRVPTERITSLARDGCSHLTRDVARNRQTLMKRYEHSHCGTVQLCFIQPQLRVGRSPSSCFTVKWKETSSPHQLTVFHHVSRQDLPISFAWETSWKVPITKPYSQGTWLSNVGHADGGYMCESKIPGYVWITKI